MRYVQLPLLLTSLILGGCHRAPGESQTSPEGPGAQVSSAPATSPSDAAPEPAADSSSSRHQVVFADRISHGYLLLLPSGKGSISREDLKALVAREFGEPADESQRARLLDFVETEPLVEDPKLVGQHASPLGAPRATTELLGLYVEMLPRRFNGRDTVAPAHLQDPILTRALDPSERASLSDKEHVLLLRADYRNRHAVLGLRLLEALVELVASEYDGLVHDPDTLETVGPAAFAARRLHATLDNIATQLVVVPFEDARHPEALRLTTRGMRRFGSVDLELDGLPRDPRALQRATDLLNGLAAQMVALGEFDPTGYAVQVPATVTIARADVLRAYGRTESSPCTDCGEDVDVHLVERLPEAHDPVDHVVARVVAPRPESDASAYDHPAWVRNALADLFGPQP